ncbi:uncharacterized protein LOC144162604 isoform X2 [Haemaphysalis longicornis]
MVWCVEFQHTVDATARSKKASRCGPGPAALPPSQLSTPPPWPASCGTVSSKAGTGAFAAVTLQLPPIWFRQGDQRQRTHQQPYSQRLSVGSSHSLGRPPYSQPRWPSGPGTELLGGLAEAISVVQHEHQVCSMTGRSAETPMLRLLALCKQGYNELLPARLQEDGTA